MNGKSDEKHSERRELGSAGAVNMNPQNSTPECCNMTPPSPQSIPSLSSYYGIVQPPGSSTAYAIPLLNPIPFQDNLGRTSSFILMQSPGHIMAPNLGQLIPLVPMQAIPIRGNFHSRSFNGPEDKENNTGTNTFQNTARTEETFPLGVTLEPSMFKSPSRQAIDSQSTKSQQQSQDKFDPSNNSNKSIKFVQSPTPSTVHNEPPKPMSPKRTYCPHRPVSPYSPSESPSSSSQQSRPGSPSSPRSLSPASSLPRTKLQTHRMLPIPSNSSQSPPACPFPCSNFQTPTKCPFSSTVRQTSPTYYIPSNVLQNPPAYPTLSTTPPSPTSTYLPSTTPQMPLSQPMFYSHSPTSRQFSSNLPPVSQSLNTAQRHVTDQSSSGTSNFSHGANSPPISQSLNTAQRNLTDQSSSGTSNFAHQAHLPPVSQSLNTAQHHVTDQSSSGTLNFVHRANLPPVSQSLNTAQRHVVDQSSSGTSNFAHRANLPPVSQSLNTAQRHVADQSSSGTLNFAHRTSPRFDYYTRSYPDSQQPIVSPPPAKKSSKSCSCNSPDMESSFRSQPTMSKLGSQYRSVNEKGHLQGFYYVSDGQIIFNPPLDLSKNEAFSLPLSMSDTAHVEKKQYMDENAQSIQDDMPIPPSHKAVQTPHEWIANMDDKSIQTACGWGGGPTVNASRNPLQYCSGSCPTSRDVGLRRKKRKTSDNCKAELKERLAKLKGLQEHQPSEEDSSRKSFEEKSALEPSGPPTSRPRERITIADLVKSLQSGESKSPSQEDLSFRDGNRQEDDSNFQDGNTRETHGTSNIPEQNMSSDDKAVETNKT